MKISAIDLKFYQTTRYLGGPISSALAPNGVINAILDRVEADDARAGGTDYVCVYFRNENPTTTFQEVSLSIKTNTPSVDSNVAFALGSSAVFGTEQKIRDKHTPPALPAGSWVSSAGVGKIIGDMPPMAWKAIWIRREIDAYAEAYKNDGAVFTFTGKTEG